MNQSQLIQINYGELFKEVFFQIFSWTFAFLKLIFITIGPAWKFLVIIFLLALLLVYIKRKIEK